MNVSLLQALLAFGLISQVFSIHCFSCSSVEDERCKNPFKIFPEAIVNCDKDLTVKNTTLKATMCRKITQTSVYKDLVQCTFVYNL